MTRVGRKAAGSGLVQHMNGSERAKLRLRVILDSLAGRLATPEACDQLGLSEAMFYRLRSEVLQAALAELEPQPLGRPPHRITEEQRRLAELSQRIAELEVQLQLAAVREELAHVLPGVAHPTAAEKKTSRPTSSLNNQRKRRARRRSQPR